jgi:hypothetical protein
MVARAVRTEGKIDGKKGGCKARVFVIKPPGSMLTKAPWKRVEFDSSATETFGP